MTLSNFQCIDRPRFVNAMPLPSVVYVPDGKGLPAAILWKRLLSETVARNLLFMLGRRAEALLDKRFST